MASDQIQKLKDTGQGVWVDYLSRDLLRTGALKRLMQEGVGGVSFSPPAFRRAMDEGGLYDRSMGALLKSGVRSQKELYTKLMLEDVCEAADTLLPVFESSGGADGFVGVEISPDLAYDTDAAIEEAGRLFREAGRRNVLIRVPATQQGLPAIAELTSEGVNVAATLIFSVERYQKVMEAFIMGLEKRLSGGQQVEGVFSVAEFFVSRTESFIDRMLDEKLPAAGSQTEEDKVRGLYGKAAVANAKMAYQRYRDVFMRDGFGALRDRGARPQKLAWESTGTRIAKYGDLKYVEELIAPDTICVMSAETIELFKDHGKVRVTVEDGLPEARADLDRLLSLGINMENVAAQMEQDGVLRFSDAYFAAMTEVAARRDWLISQAA